MTEETGQGGGSAESPTDPPEEDHDQVESGPADEGPSYGDRPGSPEPGHPSDQTQPMEGLPPRTHEEPWDIPRQGEPGPTEGSGDPQVPG